MNKKILLLLLFITIITTPIVFALEDVNSLDETYTIEENSYDANTKEYYYKNEETGYTAIIEDNASLLNEQEKAKLLDKMMSLTKFGHIAFVSIDSNSTSTASFASSYYHSNYGVASGSIFVIDMDNREIYIFSDGDNYDIISSDRAYSITDNTYRYASNRDYYNCAYYSFDQIESLLNGYKIAEPMRYTSSVFIALTISFFISFLIVLANTRIKKADDSEIVKRCDVNFQVGEVTAYKTGTHRVYSPPSDSSSSGGGGGGGGGGGSSGGGGGHSF